jgi:hypothetical protein
MSSIASATSQAFSPLSLLQKELASEVSSGTISSSDQSALSSALTDIDSAMKSQAPTAGSGSPPSPTDMQSKINDLISGEVSDGKLTSAQADELKNVFSKAFQGGPGGPGGTSGTSGTDGDSDTDSSSSTSTTSTSSTDSDVSKLMQDFLKLIKDSQSSSSSNYCANGNSLVSQMESLIVNYQT